MPLSQPSSKEKGKFVVVSSRPTERHVSYFRTCSCAAEVKEIYFKNPLTIHKEKTKTLMLNECLYIR